MRRKGNTKKSQRSNNIPTDVPKSRCFLFFSPLTVARRQTELDRSLIGICRRFFTFIFFLPILYFEIGVWFFILFFSNFLFSVSFLEGVDYLIIHVFWISFFCISCFYIQSSSCFNFFLAFFKFFCILYSFWLFNLIFVIFLFNFLSTLTLFIFYLIFFLFQFLGVLSLYFFNL